MELTATFKQLLPLESGTTKDGKAWQKQSFVVETNGKYPQNVCLSISGDRIAQLEKFSPGDIITVQFDISSREWYGKWYTDCRAYAISKTGTEPANHAVPIETATPTQDSLPF